MKRLGVLRDAKVILWKKDTFLWLKLLLLTSFSRETKLTRNNVYIKSGVLGKIGERPRLLNSQYLIKRELSYQQLSSNTKLHCNKKGI